MATDGFVLAIDQGTSGTKTLIVDGAGRVAAQGRADLPSLYPAPGWVEQDPDAIYDSVLRSAQACLSAFRDRGGRGGRDAAIRACGISNQRETFVLWDDAGRPVGNAVVWQCKRSVPLCDRLVGSDVERHLRATTGLILDPYFSATKLAWMVEQDPDLRAAIAAGRVRFGTVDSWLLHRLTGGRAYAADRTNACRTLLFDIHRLSWDQDLLAAFGLEGLRLPDVHPSVHPFGATDLDGLLEAPVPITAMIGDSHAAAFGEGCFHPGEAKATLGTGSSVLLMTGERPIPSQAGMVTTIGWALPDQTMYALEGIIVTCGATLTWLRDQVGLFADSRETEALATAVPDAGGVVLIPGFAGLGAPHWKMAARGALMGLTFGTDRRHIVRAALESIGYQIKDVIAAMERDSALPLHGLRLNGGVTGNRFVVQFIADLLDAPAHTSGVEDVSALGAAFMAGLGSGLYADLGSLAQLTGGGQTYAAGTGRAAAARDYAAWQAMVAHHR
ncbi:glycerol kinase GlpK [Roseospira marina]|uniref:ATP:glycerol 3-phosphotransferase n=1 Tax=Roseospira marina TaxID=140057 RepID=A0A5M6IAT0_9PROT|nr:glycerol kinase GlpK [Roseospira marina]KAA5605333.1 glycerol kinase GlpK [Roseospira marina]MBB4314805.1 glycerol kinase [Roseospira marina]MBB5087794.1 glycerol kinase [Roseospira marina]